MKLSKTQMIFELERWAVIHKFQEMYTTSKEKEEALKKMDNKDIRFLIYCSDNMYANIFYSKFLKKEENIMLK